MTPNSDTLRRLPHLESLLRHELSHAAGSPPLLVAVIAPIGIVVVASEAACRVAGEWMRAAGFEVGVWPVRGGWAAVGVVAEENA